MGSGLTGSWSPGSIFRKEYLPRHNLHFNKTCAVNTRLFCLFRITLVSNTHQKFRVEIFYSIFLNKHPTLTCVFDLLLKQGGWVPANPPPQQKKEQVEEEIEKAVTRKKDQMLLVCVGFIQWREHGQGKKRQYCMSLDRQILGKLPIRGYRASPPCLFLLFS